MDGAKKPAGANLVAKRVTQRAGIEGEFEIGVYHKGGLEMRVEIQLSAECWPELIYALIPLPQRLAPTWTITSTIEDECYLISDDVPVPGVTTAHLFAIREKSKKAPEPTSRLTAKIRQS